MHPLAERRAGAILVDEAKRRHDTGQHRRRWSPQRAGWLGALHVVAWLAAAALPVQAQESMAQCRAQMPAAAAQQLRACEEHSGCRAVLRIIDSCRALATFADVLTSNAGSGKVNDSVLRRTLVDAGVPANGLASCTSEFNRALCRNFLNLEDGSGETAAGPTLAGQFDAALRRLVEQHDRARMPADQHRAAEIKLEACAGTRPGPERDTPCREAIDAVRACEFFRAEWAQRRAVLLVDAHKLGRADAQRSLRALEIPPCPQTLPGSTLTPQQALVAATADVPDNAAGLAAPAAPAAPAASPAAERAPAAAAPPPSAPARPEGATGSTANAAADCRASLRRMEERFEAIQRRRPAQADRLATQQVEIYMLTEQMGLLERLCRGQREHEFLRPTQERLARTLQACRESAPNPVNDCVPRVAW